MSILSKLVWIPIINSNIKYVVIWKREGKNWKLHRDIFNSDNPA